MRWGDISDMNAPYDAIRLIMSSFVCMYVCMYCYICTMYFVILQRKYTDCIGQN